jgi:hypothetical protein
VQLPSATVVDTVEGDWTVGKVGLRFVIKGLVLPQVPYPVRVHRFPKASFTEVVGLIGIAGSPAGFVYTTPGPGLVRPVEEIAVA